MGTREIDALTGEQTVFSSWLQRFGEWVESGDFRQFQAMFSDEAYWRDLLAFTWEHRTFAGPAAIAAAFAQAWQRVAPKSLRAAGGRSAPRRVKRSGRWVIEGYFDFDCAAGRGVGFVRLLVDTEPQVMPRVWLLLTSLHDISGAEEKTGRRRPTGDEFSQIVAPFSWAQLRDKEKRFEDRDPQVLIVGAGQGGLILAARLRQMGVDALVIDRIAKVGDNWRDRYNNLTLHNEIVANHFPYLPFPETWPLWLPKDMLGNWLESYAEFLELNVWTATELTQAVRDEASGQWLLELKRADGSMRRMRCPHLVMATGVSGGAPRRPALPGLDGFKGRVMHSSEFGSGVEFADKRALVIGTGNSGHDVAQDLYVSGAAAVHIMQRGPTCVVSLDPSARISYGIYTEGRPVEDVDLMTAAIPYDILIDTYQWVTRRTAEYDRTLLEGLHSVGFKTHDGEDGTGFQLLYLRGGGGYYIDVGCCQLVIDRKIGLVQAEDTEGFEVDGLRMRAGSFMPLDLVVLATGFEGMESSVRKLLGNDVADRVGPVWGFDQDKVMRNMWRRTAQDGLWLMGGAIIEARLYSRFLALEILASLKGVLPPREAMPLVSRPPA